MSEPVVKWEHQRDLEWMLAFVQLLGPASGLTVPITPEGVAGSSVGDALRAFVERREADAARTEGGAS